MIIPEYYSYSQYLQHPKFKAIRKIVMDRANGICEDCKANPATEPHHLKYPKWGTFDVPENLVAVCHNCHCMRHRKRNYMPVINGIGISPETPIKQDHFKTIVEKHLKIVCDGIFKKNYGWVENNKYFYYDMNAGSGFYEGIVGSPLIFLNEAIKYRHVQFNVYLFEIEPDNIVQLERIVSEAHYPPNINIHYIQKDSSVYLTDYLFYSHNQQFGMVYSDPTGSVPPFDTLAKFSQRKYCQRTDIVINFAASTIKRIRGSSKCIERRCLTDYLSVISKKAWIIRENHGKHQWTFLIGANWINFPEFRGIGFRYADSAEGQSILDNLNMSAREKKTCRQQSLVV